MRKVLLFFLAVYCVAIATVHVHGQERNSVIGFVFDENRRPVANAYVELLSDFYSSVARARTQGSGMYTFTGLAAGHYYVKVLSVGIEFEEQTKPVSLVPIAVVQGRGSAFEQVDFYLKARKPTTGTIISGSPGVIFAQDVPPEAKALYDAGVVALALKDDQGLEKIKRSIEIFPDYYMALDRLGQEYLSRGFYEAAYILLGKAVGVNPRSFPSTLSLGLAAFRIGQKAQALERFKQAATMDKGSINAHLWLGIALHEKRDLEGSLAALNTANKIGEGKVPEVHWQLARVYKDQNKYAAAADSLEQFLKYRPDAQNAEEIRKIILSLRQKTQG